MRPVLAASFLLFIWLLSPVPARAQLATSFYNITGIQTRVLPNAVQLTIRTDGAIQFGGDLSEFVSIEASRFQPRQVTSFRLRLLRARAQLPAFVDIGAYPVDAAIVTLGTDEMERPFFGPGRARQDEPRVDIRVRFFVPVTVRRFTVDRRAAQSSEGEGDVGINFGGALGPRDVRVEMGSDRRSVLITVISDRVDSGHAARLRRSPSETHKHRLSVAPTAAGRWRIEALHTPLAQILDAVARAANLPLVVRADAAEAEVSLHLPSATPEEFLRAVAIGYGLVVSPRSPEEGGGFAVGRGGPPTITERLPLKHLAPERARLLFPDFLLPFLHADEENNALIASGSPHLMERLRADLARLDQPRAQVRVEASIWEFSSTEAATLALQATRTVGNESVSLDTGAGALSLRVEKNQKRGFAATVDALAAAGRARLLARPFVIVASGESGTLFLGQRRYVTVLQQRRGRQVVQALPLSIGYSLSVLPTVGADDDVTLEFTPRISTVDDIEEKTGLPTLGIREVDSVVRVRPDDAIIVAGLDSDQEFHTRRRLPARRNSRARTALIVLVTVRKV